MLQSNGCESLINSPTRFSLNSKPFLLDHIYTNNVTCVKICDICFYHVSDHLSVFVIMKKCNYAYSNNSVAYARCMRNFNSESF